MARYNDGFGICFNDNDGGATYFVRAQGLEEYRRYVSGMGRWRAKLHFIRLSWIALQRTEEYANVQQEPRWKRLRGWKP